MVAHGGGLPGYGSLMRWLPDYGVGIIAFGNVTYTGWGRVVGEAFDRLAATGGAAAARGQAVAGADRAQRDVSRLVVGWDDGLADSIAAENLFLDRSKDRRRREIEDLARRSARARRPTGFDVVENALRGQWTMAASAASCRCRSRSRRRCRPPSSTWWLRRHHRRRRRQRPARSQSSSTD